MALERVPADIRAQGGVARMSDPKMIREIMATVTIPVMAKARIGHFVECQVRIPPAFSTLSAGPYSPVVDGRSSKPLVLTTSTSPKFSRPPTPPSTSPNTPSACPSSAAAATWARPFAASMKALL